MIIHLQFGFSQFISCRGPSKVHSWFQLAQWFRIRSLKCEKFTDDRQQTTDDGRQVMAIVELKTRSKDKYKKELSPF
jgi:hypothetical protein